MDQAMIEFQSVTKQFQGGQPAVDNLSMSIGKGSITVFVGPSGCGKTTSLRMINRMVEPTSGAITVDGKDVTLDENLFTVLNDKGDRDFTLLVNSKPGRDGARRTTGPHLRAGAGPVSEAGRHRDPRRR